MNTQEKAPARMVGQRMEGGEKRSRLPHGAIIALIGAIAVVTTTVILIGGTEPANACFLGIPCW